MNNGKTFIVAGIMSGLVTTVTLLTCWKMCEMDLMINDIHRETERREQQMREFEERNAHIFG